MLYPIGISSETLGLQAIQHGKRLSKGKNHIHGKEVIVHV
ncbi:hypothetical protein EDO6_05667 [Paenibacillus xylanexedens]|nr:hypothetical protein EDO6_05667 [Paenibacillus xylanexedens]